MRCTLDQLASWVSTTRRPASLPLARSCTFYNNSAYGGSAGALALYGVTSAVTIANSVFDRNSAKTMSDTAVKVGAIPSLRCRTPCRPLPLSL